MALKESISGIRGIVGTSFTPQVIIDYVSAFSDYMPDGKILIGRDSRPSGHIIVHMVKSALGLLGRKTIDIGIVPTPTVLFGVAQDDFAGGIVITASHNPLEWNALKLVNSEGKFISPDQFKELKALYDKKNFTYADYNELGKNFYNKDIPQNHLQAICDYIDTNAIKTRGFTVAVDTVNGAGGRQVITLLEKLNCKVIPINTDETGYFSHPPEPTPENLSDLSELIKKEGADIGFALDPDGDRLVIAAEDGTVLSEEMTLALSLKHFLTNHSKTDIVINTSSSRVSEDIAAQAGVKVYRVPTGEIHVTEKMESLGALIGGEGNGGVILPAINKCRDAYVGIGLILEMLAGTDKPVSTLAAQLPQYSLVKKKFPLPDEDFSEIEKKITIEFSDYNVDNQDGIRIDMNDKWVLIRKSNTEPIIRIFAESKSNKEAEAVIQKIKTIIGIS